MQCVRNCDPASPDRPQHFEQPVLQTAQMFVGEMGCWLVVAFQALYGRYTGGRRRSTVGYTAVGAGLAERGAESSDDEVADDTDNNDNDAVGPIAKRQRQQRQRRRQPSDARRPLRGYRVLLLALPASCDIAGTTLMNVGLLFVAASIYQMTRGALVLFVGVFSVVFLARRLRLYQWSALVLVMLGVAVVGLAGAVFRDHKATPSSSIAASAVSVTNTLHSTATKQPATLRTIIGILLIAGAQIFTAAQFVLEEWILEHYALEPLKVVGWEGVFGLSLTIVGMIGMHFAVGRTERGRYGYFDAREGIAEVLGNRAVAVSSVLIMVSIG